MRRRKGGGGGGGGRRRRREEEEGEEEEEEEEEGEERHVRERGKTDKGSREGGRGREREGEGGRGRGRERGYTRSGSINLTNGCIVVTLTKAGCLPVAIATLTQLLTYISWRWTLLCAACTIPLPETKAVLSTISWTVAGEEGG